MRRYEELTTAERAAHDEQERVTAHRVAARRAISEELVVVVKHRDEAACRLDQMRGVDQGSLNFDERLEHATAMIRTEQRVDQLAARQAHIHHVLKDF